MLYDSCVHILQLTSATCIFTQVWELGLDSKSDLQSHSRSSVVEDFSRSQLVKYTVNVAISQKWCKIRTVLLQTTNRKWYMTYQIAAAPMTLSDLQIHSSTASLFQMVFCTYVQQLTRCQLTYIKLCNPSAVAELLVYCKHKHSTLQHNTLTNIDLTSGG